MKFSEVFTSKDSVQLDKKTLVFLRWIAIVGQFLTISIVYFIFKFELPFLYCSLIIFIGVLTNIYLQFKFKSNQLNNFTSTCILFYDLIQLSLDALGIDPSDLEAPEKAVFKSEVNQMER